MEMEDYILYICVPCRTKLANYDSIVDHFEQFHSDKIYEEDEEWDEESQNYGINVEDEEEDEEFEEYLENHTYKRCRICPTSIASGSVHSFRHADLWNHLITNHNRYYGILEVYKCKTCDIEFTNKENLESHSLFIHSKGGLDSEDYSNIIIIRSCFLIVFL